MESKTHKKRWKGKNLLLFVGFGCVVIGLLFLFYGYTNTWRLWGIPSITDRSIQYSFGANVFGMFIRRIIPNYPLTENLFRFLPGTALLLLLIFVLWLNKREIRSSISKEHEYIDSFRMGSAIYLGLFAWGNNYDYKLMFLLFMIPQVLAWTRYAPQRIALISRLTISATMFSFWYMFILRFIGSRSFGGFAVFFLEQLSNWVIFGGLLYLFVYSMPEWAGHYIRRTGSR